MQPFVLYNSEQRKKVEFVPRKEGQIDMYVCGMTVYDYCHIGHARVMVAFDYIIRFCVVRAGKFAISATLLILMTRSLPVPMKMAKPSNNSPARFIDAMNEDAANLGCLQHQTKHKTN